jgi:hypothetical protein
MLTCRMADYRISMFLQSRLNQTRYPTHPLHRAMSVFSVNSVIVGFFDFTSWRDAGALLACSKGMHIEGIDRVMHSKFVQSLKDRLEQSQTSLATSETSLAIANAEADHQTYRADDLAAVWNRCATCAVKLRNRDMFAVPFSDDVLTCFVCSEREYTVLTSEYYYLDHPNNREMIPRTIHKCERCEGAPVIIGRQALCVYCKVDYEVALDLGPSFCAGCQVTDATVGHYTRAGSFGGFCTGCVADQGRELITYYPGEINVLILETIVPRM